MITKQPKIYKSVSAIPYFHFNYNGSIQNGSICFPHSFESREWPLLAPLLRELNCWPGTLSGCRCLLCKANGWKDHCFQDTPTEMVHVMDPLVKSQLFNILVVVFTAVSWQLRAGDGETWTLSPPNVSNTITVHHLDGLSWKTQSPPLFFIKIVP